jgi:cellobiose-specific phosphotransferase system component IIB
MKLQFAVREEATPVRRGDPADNVPDPNPPLDADDTGDDEDESSDEGAIDDDDHVSDSDEEDFSDEEEDEEEDDDTPLPDGAFKGADGPLKQLFPGSDFDPPGVAKLLKGQLALMLRTLDVKMLGAAGRAKTASEMAAAKRKRARSDEDDGEEGDEGAEADQAQEEEEEALPRAKRRMTTSASASASGSTSSRDPYEEQATAAFEIIDEPSASPAGSSFRITVRPGHERLFGMDSRQIATSALLETYALLDEAICRNYYRILEAQGATIALATTDGPVPLFQKMAHVSLLRLRNMVERNKGEDLKLLSTLQKVRSPDFIYYRSGRLWVPEKTSLFLYEIGRPFKLFSKSSGAWQGTNVQTGRKSVYRLNLPPQSATEFELDGRELLVSGSGAGGGGEMRADRGTEVEYRWHLDGAAAGVDAATFATACGLWLEWKRERSHREAGFRKVPTAFPGLIYWRKWIDGDAAGRLKKNYPETTLPLSPMVTAAGLNASKADWITLCSEYGPLRKKKMKGAWSADRLQQAGVTLSRKKKLREGAGGVMRKQLGAIGYGGDATSATKFVEAILADDSASERSWNRFSRDVVLRSGKLDPSSEAGKAALKAAKTALRTSQEWCHLHGQGDGGREQLENFVAGSEHANTEQLAIETAQRLFSYKGLPLNARMTAYLMPGDGFARTSLLKSEVKTLENAGWDAAFIKRLRSRKVAERKAAFADFLLLAPQVEAYNKVTVSKGAGKAATAKILGARDDALTAQLPAAVVARISASKDPRRWLAKLAEELTPMFRMPAPIAVAVRYKVYLKSPRGEVKAFDHLIQMQRESFDLLEYRFLYWAVQVALARRLGDVAMAQVLARMMNPERRKKVIGLVETKAQNGSSASSASTSTSSSSGSASSGGGVPHDTGGLMDVDAPTGNGSAGTHLGGGS